MKTIKGTYYDYQQRLFRSVWGTILATFITDKFVLPKIVPKFTFPSMRLAVWGFKYLLLPMAAFGITKHYFSNDYDQVLQATMSKYKYTFDDFRKINYAIEK